METEKTSHEMEKSLHKPLSQTSATQQTEKLHIKQQNGDQSPETLFQQFNGDTNQSHFKSSMEVFPMKNPDNTQGLFDQSMYEMNGNMKNALGEQTFLDFHQSKRLCTGSEMNGDEDLEFPKHNKPVHHELNRSKRNFNFPSGDIFSLSSNKQVPMPNGAIKNPHSVKGTTGDLLEKTLSQYYPEHVSIAPQTNSSQVHQVTSNLSEQATSSPSFTSGFPSSPQTSASEPLAKVPPEVQGLNGYNPEFTQNGYCVSFAADKRQRKSTYLPSNLSDMEKQQSLCKGGLESNVPPQTGIDGYSQIRKDKEGLSNDYECLSMFSKSNQDFNQESYILPREVAGSPFSSEIDGTLNSFNSLQTQRTQMGQQNIQMAQKKSADGSFQDNRDSSLPQQQTLEMQKPESSLHEKQDKPQPHQKKTILQSTNQSSHIDWIDLNSAPPPQTSNKHPHTWDFFLSQAASMQQQKIKQSQSHPMNHIPPNSLHSQNFSKPNFPTHESQTENSYKNSQPPTQLLPQQSSGSLSQAPPVEPLQQATGSFPHQLPQNGQSIQADPQSEGASQSQTDEPILKRPKMEDCPYSESQMLLYKTSQDYKNMSQTDEPILKRPKMEDCPYSESQMLPYKISQDYKNMIDESTFSDPSKSNTQLLSNEVQAELGDATQIQKKLQQKNIQYSQSTSKQHQHYQQGFHQRAHNDLEFFQHPHLQSHLLQDSNFNSLQTPTQTFQKAEFQETCAQIQRGSLSTQGAQADMQKHAALRMHLLQKQERQDPNHTRSNMESLTTKNPSLEVPAQKPPLQQWQDQDKVKVMPVVKQEAHSLACDQSQQRSILATMEQQLKQYELSPMFERKSLVIKSPNKVKVEMAGDVTVLSTSTEGNINEQCKSKDLTPSKKIENGLQSFLDSPMKLLNTPIKNLLNTPSKTQYDIPSCHCLDQISEKDEGPYYTHLGAASTVAGIREIMESRSGLSGSAIRIEKVVYTGKEGKSSQGCPIAKWVIRRASVDEKLLVIVRERVGHSCETSCIVVVILVWEGISTSLADSLYSELSDTLTKHGALTNRRCAHNEERTCACQGFEPDASGASFSFGCSWSMYYNGCKFARSKVPRKFKLLGDDPKEEEKLEQNLQGLATLIAPVYKKMAPDAYSNQVEHEHRAPDCRLGLKEGRPFSGVTACLDFCAHAHRDLHNMLGGSTVVCTLTREDNREIGKIPEDEQLHVLPLYKASSTDEFGSAEAQLEKTKTGAIQVLSAFRRQVRMLPEPVKSCRQRKLDSRKSAVNKSTHPNTPNKTDNTQQAKKQSVNENLGQNTPITGSNNMKKTPDTGQPLNAYAAHQQQPQPTHPNPSSLYTGSPFPRFSNAQGTLPNTSKLANLHRQTPSPTSPYLHSQNMPNSYMNASTPYSRSLTPNPVYPGYQHNVGAPMDNYASYYSNSVKHMDIYQSQRNSLYPEQQYNAPHYGVNYPSHYGESRMPVNGYNTCNVRPGMHSIGQYRAYSPNMPPDAFLRPPLAHSYLDYAAANKSSQSEVYPKSNISQNSQNFPLSLDNLRMQGNNLEMNVHRSNGISQVFPPVGNDCINPNQPPSLKLSNDNVPNSQVNQEPNSQTLEQKEEEVWSDSEHNFLNPEIGGVAVAPSHGSIIIECAKRELHATTPLSKPDRNHPTRISLVFYQHKNLNEAKHGLAMWEAKMAEKAREKEEDAEKHGAENTSSKSSNKKVKRENTDPSEPSENQYKQFLLMLNGRSMSCTTNTYVNTSPYAFTKVTGPYNDFL
ncbi:methylcytosine dioxygenase TET2 [Misgurnus anguillicaudatus]|uniref:methylcytosine dioxygenase TET2 n=1 Tax=Misgurnus anguillicaudatus TaxID=75329 RepID=UPI003CCF9AAD